MTYGKTKNRHTHTVTAMVLALLLFGGAILLPAFAQDESIEGIRLKGVEFLQTLIQREYDTYARGKTPELGVLLTDYHYLYNENKIATITKAWEQAAAENDAENEEAYNRFRLFLIEHSVWQEAMPFVNDLALSQLESGIQAGNKVIAVREAADLLATEEDRSIRRQVYLTYSQNAEREGVYLAQVNNLFGLILAQKGFESYLDFRQQQTKINFEELSRVASQVLDDTESLYVALLEEALSEDMGIELVRARTFDIMYLMCLHQYDEYFKKKELEKKARVTFETLGFKIKDYSGLKIELSDDRNRIPGFNSFISIIPRKVFLSGKPIDSVTDYEGLLGELGRCLFYLNTQEERFEFRRLGPKTLDEIFVNLFSGLVNNPSWVEEYAGIPADQMGTYMRRRSLVELYKLRRECAAFIFGLRLYGDERTPWRAYNEIMEAALKWRHTDLDSKHYLTVSRGMQSAERLRGMFLAALVRKVLRERYGMEWYAQKEVRDALRRVWAAGLRPEPVEVVYDLGVSEVGPLALL